MKLALIVWLLAGLSLSPEKRQIEPVLSEAATVPVPVREGYVETPDQVRLYYRVAGEGEDVVIAPFALYHASSLDRLAKNRRVVTYDPRGRGNSAAVDADKISLDHLLLDFETVRRAVGAERVSIIGWSGAGMEMFVYAMRNPGRVERLVQLAPVTARAAPYTAEMIADRRRRTDQTEASALQARVDAGAFADDPAGHCRASNMVQEPALVADRASLDEIPDVCIYPNEHPQALSRYFGALWPAISSFDWRDALDDVQVPRLVIYPLQDNITRAGVEEWVHGQENARLLLIDRSGHFPQYEQADLTLRAIETFLDGSWPDQAFPLPAR